MSWNCPIHYSSRGGGGGFVVRDLKTCGEEAS